LLPTTTIKREKKQVKKVEERKGGQVLLLPKGKGR